VEGFGSGNLPGAVCEDMVPGRKPSQHGENEVSQKDDLDPPFLVTATKLDDKQFIIVNVGVDQARFPNRGFKGMLLMAEAHGQRGHGYFVPLKESKDFIKPFNCVNLPECEDIGECQGTANAMVHKNPQVKTNVSALWFPPSAMTGEITFVVTVVERNDNKGSVWFENLTSLPIFV